MCKLLVSLAFLFVLHVSASAAAIDYDLEASTTSLKNFDINGWIRAGKFAQLEKKLGLLAADQTRDENNERLIYRLYGWNVVTDPELDAQTSAWCKAYPKSYFSWAFRGTFLISYAWAARGGDFAGEVPESAWPLFEQRLEESSSTLQTAMKLNPHDPFAPCQLEVVAKGLNLPISQANEYFKAAIADDPSFYIAYSQMLDFLKPKWGGTREIMFAFARHWAAQAPPHSRLNLLLLNAHKEMSADFNEGMAHWKKPGVWDDIRMCFETELKWRDTPLNHNKYAYYAQLCGSTDTLRRELNAVGIDWDEGTWSNIQGFLAARDSVFPADHGASGGFGQAKWLVDQATAALRQKPQEAKTYVTRAAAYEMLWDFQNSKQDLEQAIRLDESNVSYSRTLALLEEERMGQKEAAYKEMKRAYELNPHDAQTRTWLIPWMVDRNQWQALLPITRLYFKDWPADYSAQFYSILAEAHNGATTKALELANAHIAYTSDQLRPIKLDFLSKTQHDTILNQAFLMEARGYAYWRAGNAALAAMDCMTAQHLLAQPTIADEVLANIAMSSDSQGLSRSDALRYAQDLIKLPGWHGDADYYILGRAEEQANDWAAAAEAFRRGKQTDPAGTSCSLALAAIPPQQLVNSTPTTVEGCLMVADLRLKARDFAGAEAEFAAAARLDPGNADVYYRWGTMHAGRAVGSQAYAHLKKALALSPNDPRIAMTIIPLDVEHNAWKEALALLRKHAAEWPDNLEMQVYLIMAEAQAGVGPQAAIQMANQHISVSAQDLGTQDLTKLPDNEKNTLNAQAMYMQARGYAEFLAGDLRGACWDCQVSIAKSGAPLPPTVVALDTLYVLRKDPPGSDESYILNYCQFLMNLRIYHGPDHYWLLGRAYELNNNPEEALKAYQQGLAIDPGDTSCSLRLKALGKK